MFAGSIREIDAPFCHVWLPVWLVTTGTPRIMAEKVSVAVNPMLSLAVTTMASVCVVVGAMPLKVSLVALNVNQEGSTFSFDNLAA